MSDIKTATVPVLVKIPKDLLTRIEDYRFSARIPSRSAAVRELIEKGLAGGKV